MLSNLWNASQLLGSCTAIGTQSVHLALALDLCAMLRARDLGAGSQHNRVGRHSLPFLFSSSNKHLLSHGFSGQGFGSGLAGHSGQGSLMRLQGICWLSCHHLKARLGVEA